MDKVKEGRLRSLDALRGFDMLFICGLSGLIVKICTLCGSPTGWLATQMKHVAWDGFAHHDTIFPLFLFIAGVTFPFSLARQQADGRSTWKIWLRTLRRGLVLVLLGMVYNGLLKFDFAHLRVFSVLGRIGLAWMLASWIWMFFGTRMRIAWLVAILLGAGALSAYLVAPDFPDASPFTKNGNIACWFDRTFFRNHSYSKLYDPEGLLCTIPAIATALLGMFAGAFIRWEREGLTGNKKTLCLFGAAAVLGVAAYAWGRVLPINKALWSSTFVLAAGSYSFAVLALFYWIVDVKMWRGWTFPLRVVGMNAITIYLLQCIVDFDAVSRFFLGGVAVLLPQNFGAALVALGHLAVCWLVLLFLYLKMKHLLVL